MGVVCRNMGGLGLHHTKAHPSIASDNCSKLTPLVSPSLVDFPLLFTQAPPKTMSNWAGRCARAGRGREGWLECQVRC